MIISSSFTLIFSSFSFLFFKVLLVLSHCLVSCGKKFAVAFVFSLNKLKCCWFSLSEFFALNQSSGNWVAVLYWRLVLSQNTWSFFFFIFAVDYLPDWRFEPLVEFFLPFANFSRGILSFGQSGTVITELSPLPCTLSAGLLASWMAVYVSHLAGIKLLLLRLTTTLGLHSSSQSWQLTVGLQYFTKLAAKCKSAKCKSEVLHRVASKAYWQQNVLHRVCSKVYWQQRLSLQFFTELRAKCPQEVGCCRRRFSKSVRSALRQHRSPNPDPENRKGTWITMLHSHE